MDNKQLFLGLYISDAENIWRQDLIREIQNYDMASVIMIPSEELEKYFVERYTKNPPLLKKDEIYLLDIPKEITVQERIEDRIFGDEFATVNQNYIEFTVCIPFEGDNFLFQLKPTSFSYNVSREMNATITDTEIHLYYKEIASKQSPDKVYEADVSIIETNLQNLKRDIDNFNISLLPLIKQELTKRRANATTSQNIIQSFKIPIKKRNDVPTTYAIPDLRKTPRITEDSKIKTFTPEPTLELGEYENILSIIKDMSLAMERSPHVFAKLEEEDIRNFFIILLNGHYQGNTTGETFNGSGKTDIIVRYKNANAFIAECKFWKGQKVMTETIDQLLGYVTWRDTKTSILLFNKQRDFSSVIEKAKKVIRGHKNFKSEYKLSTSELESSESIFSYKFVHPTDPEKEIYLTFMAFQITQA